ncbi:MAG: penicillin-binding protein activator [Nitrospirae bacterium]|nr:penicillin-binding protein activator [Nitrospirota bacterium]
MLRRLGRVLVLCTALLLGALAGGAGAQPEQPEQPSEGLLFDDPLTDITALDAADRLFLAGDMKGAASAYKRALATFPDTSYLDQALYRLGVALSSLGQQTEARDAWERLLAQVPESPFVEEVGGELLAIYRRDREWDRVLDILLGRLGRAQPEQKAGLLIEIADARLALGEPGRAIQDRLRRQGYLPPEARAEGLAELHRLVDERMTVDDLESIAGDFPDAVPGAWIQERLVRHYLDAGVVYKTDHWAARYEAAYPREPFAREIGRLVKEQRKRLRAHRTRVAVLLPLSGPLAGYGEPVLNGIRLALQQARERLPDGELALWVRDQGDGRPLLTGHVKPLFKEAEPDLLIGPLLSTEVEQTARQARAEGVPLIAPLVPTPAGAGGGVVGLGVAPEAEGVAAARHAFRSAGLSRFVILAPVGAYGDRVGRAFADELARLGGSVQETIRYAEGVSEVRLNIEAMVKRDLKGRGIPAVTEGDVARLGAGELALAGLRKGDPTAKVGAVPPPPLQGPPLGPHPYFPGFDAVFLPGPWQQVVLVAPQLPFLDINVPIVGSPGWNDLRLIKKGGQAVLGARFVTPLFRGADPGRAFANAYQDAYDRMPDLFAALGYDAMNLAIRALLDDGARTGGPWPRLVGPFAGVTGALTVADDGSVERDFAVLEIRRRGFSQLERVATAPEPARPVRPAATVRAPTEAGEEVDPAPLSDDSWVWPADTQ